MQPSLGSIRLILRARSRPDFCIVKPLNPRYLSTCCRVSRMCAAAIAFFSTVHPPPLLPSHLEVATYFFAKYYENTVPRKTWYPLLTGIIQYIFVASLIRSMKRIFVLGCIIFELNNGAVTLCRLRLCNDLQNITLTDILLD